MGPPRKSDDDRATAVDSLKTLFSAFKTGRLVDLLKGNGLTRTTLEELLRPESTAKLKAILTDPVYGEPDGGDRGYPIEPVKPLEGTDLAQFQADCGKVLVYKAKETFS